MSSSEIIDMINHLPPDEFKRVYHHVSKKQNYDKELNHLMIPTETSDDLKLEMPSMMKRQSSIFDSSCEISSKTMGIRGTGKRGPSAMELNEYIE